MSGEAVATLAGSRAPGQYAQASGSPAAGAVPSIGTVNKIAGSVTVLRNGVAVTLNVGDQILKSDVVQTGAGSSIAIILIDGTLLNLGAATRMTMNEFAYDANSNANVSLLNFVQGSFAFVAGQVAKTGGLNIETPVAFMGIRGTAGGAACTDDAARSSGTTQPTCGFVGDDQPSLSGPIGNATKRWHGRQRSRPRGEYRDEDLWCRRPVAERGVRSDGVVVAPPALDDDLGFTQRVEDLAVEQFVTKTTSLTPIWRIASTMPWPCETRTSTCRSFVTISSGRASSSAYRSSLMPNDILQVGPLHRGRIKRLHTPTADPAPLGDQQASQHPRAGEGELQMQLVIRRMIARSAADTGRGR